MTLSKDLIMECIADQKEMVQLTQVNQRSFSFEENGRYVFVGIRHAGKSYLLYQRMQQLVCNGHDWEEILFLNFDDERLIEFSTEDFNSLLEIHYSITDKKPIIFLDEVQRIPHWEHFARRLADQKYIVYITGSNAKMLSQDVATTLGGRYLICEVYPYSFPEFLRAKNVALPQKTISTQAKAAIKRAFNEYFFYGGMPELVDFVQKRTLLSSLYQRIYLGDICARYRVSEPNALKILVKKMAESVKQPISYRRLHHIVESTGSSISLPKIIDYVNYTENCWLIIPISNEVAKLADKESTKKYYFIDNGILSLFIPKDVTSLLENMVTIELVRRYGKDNVSYFNANNEIDFVVDAVRMAVQVSYNMDNDDTIARELIPLIRYRDSHPDWLFMLITFDTEKDVMYKDFTIHTTPIWKWLIEEDGMQTD